MSELDLWIGFISAGLTLLSTLMKDMKKLRMASLGANVGFLVYAYTHHLLPSIVLNTLLIPINTWRIYQINKLVKDIENASTDTPFAQWLVPHMEPRFYKQNQLLFKQGDTADGLYYLQSGQLEVVEFQKILEKDSLIGEIGLFSPDGTRTASIQCRTDCKVYYMDREAVYKLYYQDPRLGFNFMRLIVARLIEQQKSHIST